MPREWIIVPSCVERWELVGANGGMNGIMGTVMVKGIPVSNGE